MLCAIVLSKAAPNLLFWGPPLAILAPTLLRVSP